MHVENEVQVNDTTMAIFTQAFTLTFMAEWGDRSQIATIALASSKNSAGVVLGGILGQYPNPIL